MFRSILRYFTPTEYFESEESSRRAMIAVGTYLIVAFNNLNYSIISIAISYWGGLASQGPNLMISLLALYMFSRKVNQQVVAFFFFTGSIVCIAITIFFSGGFSSALLPWIATTPIVALMVAGKRMGLYTLVVQLGVLLMFYYFEGVGLQVPSHLSIPFPPAFILSTHVGLIFTFYVIAIVFENAKSYAMEKLSAKNDELQHAIKTLKSAQDQLIQQEKLASLGQLTAGIAHEMKNPLNFVNNFAELSQELVVELREDIQKLEPESVENLTPIVDDIAANLKVIHTHGSRANTIVKSMLQHSRGGSGQFEPTDLNALIKEFANLAFHGMRASSNPIDIELVLDLDDLVGEVPVIADDISRVFLNICNNAFDAMRERHHQHKQSGETEAFNPKLIITSRYEYQTVVICIADNGIGIPDAIKDKILQPFFTTKKGTQGTGLGLSISHDIIKAHGGELEIESKQGSGSVFKITLPISVAKVAFA